MLLCLHRFNHIFDLVLITNHLLHDLHQFLATFRLPWNNKNHFFGCIGSCISTLWYNTRFSRFFSRSFKQFSPPKSYTSLAEVPALSVVSSERSTTPLYTRLAKYFGNYKMCPKSFNLFILFLIEHIVKLNQNLMIFFIMSTS